MALAILLVLLITVAVFNVSILAIGRAGDGHTAIVWKRGALKQLHFVDSTTAACRRDRGSMPVGMSSSDMRWACETAYVLALNGNPAKLASLPYIQWVKDLAGDGS